MLNLCHCCRHSVLHHQFTNTKMDMDFQTTTDQPVRHHVRVPWNPLQRLQVLSITLYSPITIFLYSGIGWLTALQAFIIFVHGSVHGSWMLAFVPFFTFGTAFLFVTQLNHIQECCTSDQLPERPEDFVHHQVRSCVDYNHGNLLLSALSIFLNYQTYHHLFPSVSHFHFLTSKPKIDKVLAQHGVNVQPRPFHKVVQDYYSFLFKLSFQAV